MNPERRRGRGLRRPPAAHSRPAVPAPETPEEVLERAPDVSRETTERDAESAAWAALRDRPVPDVELVPLEETPPPLSRDRVLLLEALTNRWARDVRLEGPADATLLYRAAPPPPPARRPALEVVPDLDPPAPAPDPDQVAESTRRLLLEESQEEALQRELAPLWPVTPAPAPGPVPASPGEPGPVRVSDWTSRHDPRSLEYPVRSRLARAVPLQDVSLDAGPVLDQGTTPPLSFGDASACVGMACAVAANVLFHGRNRGDARAGYGPLREEDARPLYRRAQDLDGVHGNTAGTSVLAGLKAGQEAGLWPGYLWALGGTKDVAQVLLQLRVAVVVGVPWSGQLEEPDRYGVIRPGGADLGGHSLAVVGLRLGMLGGSPGPWFELQQSRGYAEGQLGRVFLHHSHLARLLAGRGEAGVPLPAELLQ